MVTAGTMMSSALAQQNQKAPDHSSWDQLVRTHVNENGNVNYKGFKNDEANLNLYLECLAKVANPTELPRNEKLAFYINLYNAATVKLILKNYPLKSILDLEKPFEKEWIVLGDQKVSLTYIENDILRDMDPRIHMAINCASYSCPKLLNRAFRAETMEAQLEEVTSDFINDPGKNKISEQKLELSTIFKWYKEDFTKNGTLIEFINPYVNTNLSKNAEISFLTYDWNLNDIP